MPYLEIRPMFIYVYLSIIIIFFYSLLFCLEFNKLLFPRTASVPNLRLPTFIFSNIALETLHGFKPGLIKHALYRSRIHCSECCKMYVYQ